MAKKNAAAATPRMIKITQVRSGAGRHHKQRATLQALGFKKHQQSVVHQDNAAIRGMIFQVQHLVEVQDLSEGEA